MKLGLSFKGFFEITFANQLKTEFKDYKFYSLSPAYF
jgi:hypothetical protein